ncbi:MAG: hypothetical protein AMJ95_10370 [Omnitrophica WOR_2 bacterium SM23_72]|nr:MAG: hypothetical protein AMJ95_10370 [Omnitrophica WOR_2 bacterium SM23_72]
MLKLLLLKAPFARNLAKTFLKPAWRFRAKYDLKQILWVTWTDFEQHIRKFERAWCPSWKRGRAKIFAERAFPRWGNASGAARNSPRQDPQNPANIYDKM